MLIYMSPALLEFGHIRKYTLEIINIVLLYIIYELKMCVYHISGCFNYT